jgi:periplasmic copper chaperone A
MRITLEIAAAIALTLAALVSLASGVKASDVVVTQAFARASPTPTAQAGAVYLSLTNKGSVPDRLVAVASDAAAHAHLHETREENGVLTMRPVEAITLAPGETVALTPGGMHVMLMGLAHPLERGQTVTLRLTFEKAGVIEVPVPVGTVGQTSAIQAP